MNKQKIIIAIVVFFVLSIVFVGGYRYLLDNKFSNFSDNQEVFIFEGTTSAQALDTILKDGKVLHPGSLKRVLKSHMKNASVKSGHYVFERGISSVRAVRMLKLGLQKSVRLTIAGTIRTNEILAAKIGKQMMADSSDIIKLLNDTAYVSKYGFIPSDVLAMIIPDSYEIWWNSSSEKILDRLKREYDNFWNEERMVKAADLKLTPKEVTTLASIVSSETRYIPEMRDIAGVYLNRLRRKMKLQADPTVAYCFGFSLSRILKKHTDIDSPYNTYKYAGLPPGPICVPSKEAIDAVLMSDKVNYLYFCASPEFNGKHLFASNYAQHQKNARAFQRAMNERKKLLRANEYNNRKIQSL